jgi:GH35 family endo-1,4-beta-xylanase
MGVRLAGTCLCVLIWTWPPAGLASDAAGPDDWKSEADARIEQIRKRDVEIVVADRLGQPVAGATVAADQIRHHFAFGSCINTNAVSNLRYQEFVTSHFEWAVLENESKWFYNEPQRDHENYVGADSILDFCEQNGILVRGHNIFWAKEEFTPPWCRSLPDSELRDEVDERLDSAVNHFRGRFLHWDVNNEMLDGDFFRRRLGPDIEPYMFRRARELDPDALLFTNDYSIMGGSIDRIQAYIDEIRSLEARGATVDAVGDQGHFWGDTVDPYQILDALDRLAVLGKPVWVTEYDAVDPDDYRRADKLENLYRAAFSHPVVDGILMWGFWAGSHWRGADAAIVDLDWTLNEAGRRYEALLASWTTHATGVTPGDGSFSYRGFHGTYQVTVDAGAIHAVESFGVAPAQGPAVLMVPLKPGSCFPAAEVRDLRLRHDRATGSTTLTWTMIPWRNDMASRYDALRSPDPADFTAAACVEADGQDTLAEDATTPLSGGLFGYLVRGAYDCPKGEGPLGGRSDGSPRAGRPCP